MIIPSDNHLNRRIHDRNYDALSGKCTEGAFLLRKERNESFLSVDWAERTTIEKTSVCPVTGKVFKVAELKVQHPNDKGLIVKHLAPYKTAHSSISGDDLFDSVKAIEIASYLADKSKMVF